MDLFSKGRAKIEDLLSQTMSIIQSRYAQSNQMFTVASTWGQIIFVLQNLAQFILFFIEDSITEMNINTATRETSIYGHAASAGHFASRSVSAVGQVELVWNGSDISEIGGGAIVIPNKTPIKFESNGTKYIINLYQDNVRFNLNNSTRLSCQIVQGIVKEATFSGSGQSLQTYNVNERFTGAIENFDIGVTVDGIDYKVYQSLYDIPFNGRGVLVRTSISQGIDVIFGTGNNGAIPPNGSIIVVRYLESTGVTGNITTSDPSKIKFVFDGDGSDLYGNLVSLESHLKINCVVPPQLGANAESLALTRIIAPKTSRSFILANPDNYITYFEKFGTFSIIEAFNLSNGTYIDDENIIYVLLVPDVTQRLSSNQNYFNLRDSDFLLTDFQKKRLLTVIDESGQKITGTDVKFLDPKISRYISNIVITTYEGYDPETVKSSIVDIYSQYFLTIRRRDIIPRSDLIALIESVPGVDSVMVFFVSEKNEKYIKSILKLPADDPKRKIVQGLNTFGDIVMEHDEIVMISGGWSDSNDVYYDVGADFNKLSSINIEITSVTPVTYNTQINALNKASIRQ